MRNVTVAAIQMSIPETPEKSVEKAEKLVRKAAAEGANVILLPELFENWYFCQERRYDSYKLALPLEENPAVRRFQTVAKELSVVLPISFYEQDGNVLYNSVAMIDADGSVMGVYRKTHIPDDHFYQEKFYFTPGDTGFKVGHPLRKDRRGDMLGSVVPGGGALHGSGRRGTAVLPNCDRLRAGARVRQHAPLAALHAGSRGGESRSGDRG